MPSTVQSLHFHGMLTRGTWLKSLSTERPLQPCWSWGQMSLKGPALIMWLWQTSINTSRRESHMHLLSGQYKPLKFGNKSGRGSPKRGILDFLPSSCLQIKEMWLGTLIWGRNSHCLQFDYLQGLTELVWSIILFPRKCDGIYSKNFEVHIFRFKNSICSQLDQVSKLKT